MEYEAFDPFEDEDFATDAAQALAFYRWLQQLASERSTEDSGSLSAAATISGRRFGRYRLEALLGRGSHGAVFRAQELRLGRSVALKVAWPGAMADPSTAARFIDESRMVAQINHRGIIRIYEAGSIGILPYAAMELVAGPTLQQRLDQDERMSPVIAANILMQVAQAVHEVHQAGIVHRDLKPANILLRGSTDTGQSLEAIVVDFGLAHWSSRERTLSPETATFAILGTDRYMSPEQACGDSSKCTPATDVFSLGSILYEALTGEPAFDGGSREEVLEQIRRADPVPLRRHQRGISGDLQAIVSKCMERNPERRYQSAADLAADLKRFLDGEPIVARKEGRFDSLRRRARRFTTRHLVAIAAVTAVFLITGLASVLMRTGMGTKQVVPAAASEAAVIAEDVTIAEGTARQHEYAANLRFANQALQRGDRAETLSYLKKAAELSTPPVHRGIEWSLLSAMSDNVDRTFPAHLGGVRAVRFSPTQDFMVSGGVDSRLIYWDIPSWKPRPTSLPFGRAVKSAEFSPDGTLLMVGHETGRVTAHRMSDHRVIFDEKIVRGRVYSICWIGHSLSAAVGGEDGTLYVIDPLEKTVRQSKLLEPSKQARAIDPTHPNEIASIAYCPHRKLLVIVKSPVEVLFLDPTSLEKVDAWEGELTAAGPGSVLYVPVGPGYLAFACANNIRIYREDGQKIVSTIPIDALIEEMRFDSGTKNLLASFRNGSVAAWSMTEPLVNGMNLVYRTPAHKGRTYTVDVSRDSQWVVSGGKDGTIRLQGRLGIGGANETRLINRPFSIEFSPCGHWLGVAERMKDGGNRVGLVDLKTARRRWLCQAITDQARDIPDYVPSWSIEFDPTGQQIAFPDVDGSISVRSCETGTPIAMFPGPYPDVKGLRFSPDGSQIIIHEPTVTVAIDRGTRLVKNKWAGTAALLNCIGTSQGERWIESDSTNWCVLNQRPKSGRMQLLGPTVARLGLATVSADGRFVAASDNNNIVYLWDLSAQSEPARLAGHEGPIQQLHFTRDGCTLFSLASDRRLRLWHVPTKSELMVIGSEKGRVLCFAIHPDNKMLVLGIQHGDSFALRHYRLGDDGQTSPYSIELE